MRQSCPHVSDIKDVSTRELEMKAESTCDDCDAKGSSNLCVCLQKCCGYIGCGKHSSNHIQQHSHDKKHNLCIQLKDYSVFCFGCQSEVSPTTTSTTSTADETASSPESEPLPSRQATPVIRKQPERLEAMEVDESYLEYDLKPRGLTGLMNIGNTCYMNSAIQSLSNCPPLTQYFLDSGDVLLSEKQTSLSRAYCILVRDMWSKKRAKYIVPSGLSKCIKSVNPQFRGYGQQDSQEFLRCLMDHLHEELKQPIYATLPAENNSKKNRDQPNHSAKRLLGGKPLRMYDSTAQGKTRTLSEPVLDTTEVQISMEEKYCDDEKRPRSKSEICHTEYKEEYDYDMDTNDEMSSRHCVAEEVLDERKPLESSAAKRMKPREYRSVITTIFDGKIQSSVQCLQCHRISHKVETFQDVSLPIPGKDELSMIHASQCAPIGVCTMGDNGEQKGWVKSIYDWVVRLVFGPQVELQDCLSAFFSADELKGDNMYSCEKCKKLRNGYKYCKVLQLPEILCIHLKRFRHETYYSSKINNFVSFPITGLDMKPFLVKDCQSKCSNYDLIAVISHHGSVGAGHYIAYAKNNINNRWYEFNDSWVSQVSADHVSKAEAYVLFYRKSSEEMNKERKIYSNILRVNENQENKYFISKQWMTRFDTCVEPGPISNTDFVCSHGATHPDYEPHIKSMVVCIPEMVWRHLKSRYGGGPVVTSVDVCKKCKRYIEELNSRRKYERDEFKRLNTLFSQEGSEEDAYCISMKWFRQWEAFVKGLEDDPPGIIDNEKIAKKKSVDSGQLSKETWDFFFEIYGGGPAVPLVSKPQVMQTDEDEETSC